MKSLNISFIASSVVGLLSLNIYAQDALHIKDNGKVGVGTAEPTAPLTVKAKDVASPLSNGISIFNDSNSSSDSNATLGTRVGGANAGDPFISFDIASISGWSAGIDNSDDDKFKIASSWDNVGSDTKLSIDRDGRVGVGTTTPSSALHIRARNSNKPNENGLYVYSEDIDRNAILAARVTSDSSGDPLISFDVGQSSGWSMGMDNSDGDKFKISNHWENLATKARVIMDSDSIQLMPTSYSDEDKVILDYTVSLLQDSSYALRPDADLKGMLGTPDTKWRKIYAHEVYSNVTHSNSDHRIKENIEPVHNTLEAVKQLNAYRYTYKEGYTTDTEKKTLGLMAQEVEKVLPELVSTVNDGTLVDRKYLNYEGIIPVLLGAIKEQQQMLEKQNSEMNTLKLALCEQLPHMELCSKK